MNAAANSINPVSDWVQIARNFVTPPTPANSPRRAELVFMFNTGE